MADGILIEIVDRLKALRPVPGLGMRITFTGEGTIYEVDLDSLDIPEELTPHRVKITGIHPDSPVGTGVRVYRGDIHDNPKGFDEGASASDVTVIVGQLAGGEVIPTDTQFTNVFAFANRTWTDKTATDVTETVYEINVDRLL